MFFNSIKEYHNNVCGVEHRRNGGVILDKGSPYLTNRVFTSAHYCTKCGSELFCLNSRELKVCKIKDEFMNDGQIQRIIRNDIV